MSRDTIDVVRGLYQRAKERSENPTDIWGIPWGFKGLDFLTGGIQQGEVTVLGADSGVGKSAIAGQVCLNVARWVRDNRPGEVVRVIHTEMSADSFLKRVACIQSRVRSKRINTGRATPEEMQAYKQALHDIGSLPIEVEDEPSSLEDSIRFIKGRTPDSPKCAWWMVDYLQEHPGRTGSNTVDAAPLVAEVLPALRNVAKKIAPGLVTSQFTKEISSRQKVDGKNQKAATDDIDSAHRPTPGDLLGGRTIIAAANVILLLYRPDHYKDIAPEDRNHVQYAELTVAKNRDGDLGKVRMFFNPSYAEYADASEFEDT